MTAFGVTVDEEGFILVNNATRLSQADAINLAIALTESVQMSRDRNQVAVPSYYDSAPILRRMESPIGQALSALRRVF